MVISQKASQHCEPLTYKLHKSPVGIKPRADHSSLHPPKLVNIQWEGLGWYC